MSRIGITSKSISLQKEIEKMVTDEKTTSQRLNSLLNKNENLGVFNTTSFCEKWVNSIYERILQNKDLLSSLSNLKKNNFGRI